MSGPGNSRIPSGAGRVWRAGERERYLGSDRACDTAADGASHSTGYYHTKLFTDAEVPAARAGRVNSGRCVAMVVPGRFAARPAEDRHMGTPPPKARLVPKVESRGRAADIPCASSASETSRNSARKWVLEAQSSTIIRCCGTSAICDPRVLAPHAQIWAKISCLRLRSSALELSPRVPTRSALGVPGGQLGIRDTQERVSAKGPRSPRHPQLRPTSASQTDEDRCHKAPLHAAESEPGRARPGRLLTLTFDPAVASGPGANEGRPIPRSAKPAPAKPWAPFFWLRAYVLNT